MTPPSRKLRYGDLLGSTFGEGREYQVSGWTAQGKLIVDRLHTGTTMTTWWVTEADLPRHYFMIKRAEDT